MVEQAQKFFSYARRAMSERGNIHQYVTDRTKSSNAAEGKKIKFDGAIAQLGERLPCTQEVGGSIPPGSTNFPA